jgi:hypothetical protein
MRPEVTIMLQLAIGIVFLLSSAPKVRRPMDFASAVTAYRVVPATWSVPVAVAVVACEAFIALTHLSGVLLWPAIALSVALLVMVVLALLRVLRRGTAVPCACFGAADEVVRGRTLARVLLLLGAEVVLWFGARPPVLLSSLRLEQIVGGAAVAVLALVLCSWLLALPDFRILLRHSQLGGGNVQGVSS